MNVVSKRQRWLALGVLLVDLGLLCLAAYVPLIRPWLQAGQQLADTRTRMLQARQALAGDAATQAVLADLRDAAVAQGTFLPEDQANLAVAALSARIEQAVRKTASDQSICELVNRTPVAALDRDASCREVQVQVQLRCGSDALRLLLHEIEAAHPRVLIDDLTIAAGMQTGSASEAGLDVRMAVIGCTMPSALMAGDRHAIAQ